MRSFLLFMVVVLLANPCLQSDDGIRIGSNNIIVFQQGFVLESLSGYGFSGATYSPIFNIATGNPAEMANFDNFSFGFAHQANTEIDSFGIPDVKFQRVNNFIPQSAGMVYPFQNLRIGAGFSQRYSAEIQFENIPIITLQYPGGTGEYTTARFKNTIYSISALLSYHFNSLITKADQFSIGTQTNMNLLRNRQSIYDLTAKLSDEEINWKFGLRYTYHHQSIEKLQFGIDYESKVNFSGTYEYNRTLSVPPNATELIQIPSILTYPATLKFGILFEPTLKFGIYSDFIYNFWEDLNPSNKNRLDISGGIVIRASDQISASLGYYLFESYSANRNEILISSNDAVYISGGIIWHYQLLNIHLVVADSHLFSDKEGKQTIGKIGFGLSLE